MASIQKTTVRRFNGIDWDSIYIASAADVTILGANKQVEEDNIGFTFDDVLETTDTVSALLLKTINRLTTLDLKRIPALESGESIQSFDASKIEGIIDRSNLPTDVSGKGIEISSEEELDKLTSADVNVGDIVKVTDGKVYLVTSVTPADPDDPDGIANDHIEYMDLADSQSDVEWGRIVNTPTTLAGYGITDGVHTSNFEILDAAHSETRADLDELMKTVLGGDSEPIVTPGPSSDPTDPVYTGNIEAAAEGDEVVWNDMEWTVVSKKGANAILALNTLITQCEANEVDVELTNFTTNMSTKAKALMVNSAFVPTQNEVSDYTGLPDLTLDYGGVHAGWYLSDGYVDVSGTVVTEKTGDEISGLRPFVVINLDHPDTTVETPPPTTSLADRITELETTIGDSDTEGTIRNDIAVLQYEMKNQDASWIKTGMLPLSVIPKAAIAEMKVVTSYEDLKNLTTDQVQAGDTVKIADIVDEDGNVAYGEMYYVADDTKLGTEDWEYAFLPYTAGTASSVEWSGVLHTPTTLTGYGITDAVNVSDLSKLGGLSNANKVPQGNALGKLDWDITGDAGTLGGHDSSYYAAAKDLSDLSNAHDVTVETVQKLVEAVLGTTEEEPVDPVIQNIIDTDTVDVDSSANITIGDMEWIILSKDEESGTATLMLNGPFGEANQYDSVLTTIHDDVINVISSMTASSPLSADKIKKVTNGLTRDEYNLYENHIVNEFAYWIDAFRENVSYDPNTETSTVTDVYGHYVDPGSGQIERINIPVPDDGPQIYARPVIVVDISTESTAPAGTLMDRVKSLEDVVGDANTVDTLVYDVAALKSGEGVKELSAEKITGVLDRSQLPSDVSGRIIKKDDVEDMYTLTTEEASNGDLVKLKNGIIYGIVDDTNLDNINGYTLLVDISNTDISWRQIQDKPTTLSGYGITDAVNVDDIIENGIYNADTNPDVAGKLVKIANDNKLHVDISGDAATLNGHEAEYFATQEGLDKLALSVPVLLDSVDDFVNPQVGQMVMIPVGAPIAEPGTDPDDTDPDEDLG